MMAGSERRPRVLFMAEAVTLAHVARPLALAQLLDPERYEVHFACDPRFGRAAGPLPGRTWPLRSIGPAAFARALRTGWPAFSAPTLERYVEQDLAVLHAVRPALVVGDFRLSLSTSARLVGVPYVAIANACWSPFAETRWPVPELPLLRRVGSRLERRLFQAARPLAFALHAWPGNAVRRRFGLPSLGLDLGRVLTDGDYTLYADVPELVPTPNRPPHHDYLGPILWSTPGPLPRWWERIPRNRRIVHVSLGNSAPSRVLPAVLDGLSRLGVTAIVATRGAPLGRAPRGDVLAAELLPAGPAARRSQLVVCSGGSLSTQQALAAGVPVLGIGSNLDQLLNMQAVVKAGAGLILRADRANAVGIASAAARLLNDAAFTRSSRRVRGWLDLTRASERFPRLVARLCGEPATAAAPVRRKAAV
jgi:UDP:flavonoid glycosyltransferase YjiC (YdhE family)